MSLRETAYASETLRVLRGHRLRQFIVVGPHLGRVTIGMTDREGSLMNVLRPIPQTFQLESDGAWRLARRVGVRSLARDSYRRLRQAEGLTHARSLAFVTALVMIQVGVGVVGLASVLQSGAITRAVVHVVGQILPGPAGQVLGAAVSQANLSASQHHYVALVIGTGGALVTTTTAMGQVESGLNRLYGIATDRPWRQRYALAALFAVSVGTLVTVAFLCLTFGRDVLTASNSGALVNAWDVARWPLGLVLLGCAVTVVLRWARASSSSVGLWSRPRWGGSIRRARPSARLMVPWPVSSPCWVGASFPA